MTKDLLEFSPITYGLERVFWCLQYLSPASWLFDTRTGIQARFNDYKSIRELTVRRSRRIEAYIGVWFIVEVVAVVIAAISRPEDTCARRSVLLISAFRVFEIVQAAGNMHVFDRLRIGDRPHYVATIARTLILSIWNYIELFVCFGTIYSSQLNELTNAKSWLDAYYFSVVTQLTIGYGDMLPIGSLRSIASVQGLIGFLFGLFVLARFIAFLPKTEPVFKDADSK